MASFREDDDVNVVYVRKSVPILIDLVSSEDEETDEHGKGTLVRFCILVFLCLIKLIC